MADSKPSVAPHSEIRLHRLGRGLDETQAARLLAGRPYCLRINVTRLRRIEDGDEAIPLADAPAIAHAFHINGFVRRVAEHNGERIHSGILLRVARLHSGLTQGKLAKALGIRQPNMISMIETGVAKLPVERAPLVDALFHLERPIFARRALEDAAPTATRAVLT